MDFKTLHQNGQPLIPVPFSMNVFWKAAVYLLLLWYLDGTRLWPLCGPACCHSHWVRDSVRFCSDQAGCSCLRVPGLARRRIDLPDLKEGRGTPKVPASGGGRGEGPLFSFIFDHPAQWRLSSCHLLLLFDFFF